MYVCCIFFFLRRRGKQVRVSGVPKGSSLSVLGEWRGSRDSHRCRELVQVGSEWGDGALCSPNSALVRRYGTSKAKVTVRALLLDGSVACKGVEFRASDLCRDSSGFVGAHCCGDLKLFRCHRTCVIHLSYGSAFGVCVTWGCRS